MPTGCHLTVDNTAPLGLLQPRWCLALAIKHTWKSGKVSHAQVNNLGLPCAAACKIFEREVDASTIRQVSMRALKSCKVLGSEQTAAGIDVARSMCMKM